MKQLQNTLNITRNMKKSLVLSLAAILVGFAMPSSASIEWTFGAQPISPTNTCEPRALNLKASAMPHGRNSPNSGKIIVRMSPTSPA